MNDKGLWTDGRTDGHDRQWPTANRSIATCIRTHETNAVHAHKDQSASQSVSLSAGSAGHCVRTDHGAWTRTLYPCTIDRPERGRCDPTLSSGSCQGSANPGCRLEGKAEARHGPRARQDDVPRVAVSARRHAHWLGVGPPESDAT